MSVRYRNTETGSVSTYTRPIPQLERSDRWEREDQHVCDVCGFEAANAAGLSNHRRTHDDE